MKKYPSVILFSGGLDSCVATTLLAQKKDSDLYLLSINYESLPSQREEKSRKKISEWLKKKYRNVREHQTLTIGGYLNLRTLKKNTLVPQGYPFTRDEAFIFLGASWLERLLIDNDGYGNGQIVIATTKEDALHFEDIRPEIYVHLNGILATKYCNKLGKEMKVSVPFIELMKHQVIEKGLLIGAPLEHTWSCYLGEKKPCRSCDQCRWRDEAFRKAGVEDPADRRSI